MIQAIIKIQDTIFKFISKDDGGASDKYWEGNDQEIVDSLNDTTQQLIGEGIIYRPWIQNSISILLEHISYPKEVLINVDIDTEFQQSGEVDVNIIH